MKNNQTLHILICGGRHFNNYELLRATATKYIADHGFDTDNTEIISGHCPGVDKMGEQFARENSVDLKVFPAEWKKYGRGAGPIRNKAMVDYLNSFENKAVIVHILYWHVADVVGR